MKPNTATDEVWIDLSHLNPRKYIRLRWKAPYSLVQTVAGSLAVVYHPAEFAFYPESGDYLVTCYVHCLKMNLSTRVLDSKLIGCCDTVDRAQTPGRHHGFHPTAYGLWVATRPKRPNSDCALIAVRTRPILILPVPSSFG